MTEKDYQDYDEKGTSGQSVPDDIDFEETSSRMQVFFKIFALLGAVGFIAIIWYAYNQGKTPEGLDQVPVIKADTSPTKVKPEHEGGLVVPHQDISVLNEGEEEAKTEHLLPPPEMPLPIPTKEEDEHASVSLPTPPEAPSENDIAETENLLEVPQPPTLPQMGVETKSAETAVSETEKKSSLTVSQDGVAHLLSAKDAEKVNDTMDELPPPAPHEEKAEEKAKAETHVKETVKEVQHEAVTETKTAVEKTVAAAPTPKPTPKVEQVKKEAPVVAEKQPEATGDYRIQLASVRSDAAAQAGWKRLQAKHKSILEGVALHVQTVDLGAKGVYHRIRAGEFTKAKAQSVCAALKSQGSDCIVVRK